MNRPSRKVGKSSIRKKRARRNHLGYALVSVLVIGGVSSLFMLALAGTTVTVLRTSAAQKHKEHLKAAAEAGFDYAYAKLNDSLTSTPPFSEIEPSSGEPFKISALPVNFIPEPREGISVSIKISYPDENASMALNEINHPMTQKDWTIVEVTAAKENSISESLRVLLKPYSPQSKSSFNMSPDNSSNSPQTSYDIPLFTYPLVTTELLSRNNGSLEALYSGEQVTPGQYQLTVQSNGVADLGNSGYVAGNIYVAGNSVTAGDSSNTKIYGRVETAGNVSENLKSREGSGGNILGLLDIYMNDNILSLGDTLFSPTNNLFTDLSAMLSSGNTMRLEANMNPVTVGSPIETALVPPSPSSSMVPPSELTNFPSFPSGSSTNPGPSIDIDSPGSFVTTTLDSTNATNTITISSPLDLYITDSGASSGSAIDVSSSSLITNIANPTDIKIYYPGTRSININIPSGQTFKSMIYAPDANITISGSGNFEGALTGRNVALQTSGKVMLETNTASLPGFQSGPSFPSSPAPPINSSSKGEFAANTSLKPDGYNITSWQRVSGKLVPKAN